MSGSPWRSLLWPLLATCAALAVLVSLGLWQLQRLAWKEAVLAQIAARVSAPPVAAPADWSAFDPQRDEYRHVTVSGTFEHDHEALVFRATGNGRPGFEGPGYLVMTPLLLADGAHVLVNRGFVPLARRDPASRLAGQRPGFVTVTGLLRSSEPRNAFTPPDSPVTNGWFTRDVAAIAAHFELGRTAPFSIDADATPNPGGLPAGGATVLAIANDHLSYALTWFGLGLALIGVFAVYAWGKVSTAAAPNANLSAP